MKITRRTICGWAAVAAVGLLWQSRPLPALAQSSASTAAPLSATSPFLQELTERAKQNHVLYLVEGEPPHEDTSQTNPPGYLSREPLSDLAARFNYRMERMPSGIVVFHKTYYDEQDLPSVTLTECLAALHDVERVTEAVNPHVPPPMPKHDPLVDGLLASFGSEQFDAMQRGQAEVKARAAGKLPSVTTSDTSAPDKESGLPVMRLNPQQKAEVWRIACYLYVQEPLRDFGAAFQKMKVTAGEMPFFVFHDLKGKRFFGYEVTGKFVPLSNPYQRPTPLENEFPNYVFGDGEPTPPHFDPTQPKEKTAFVPSVATTLQAVVNALNGRNETGQTVFVDEELAAKRIAVAGNLSQADPVAVLRALAAVYGLRVINAPDTLTLARVRARVSDNAAQTSAALGELLPLPLMNACRQTLHADDPALQKVTYPGFGVTLGPHPATTAIKWAAVRRLRQTVEAKINASPDKRVSLADLDETEKQAFAVAVTAPCLPPLDNFVQTPVPPFIARFDQTVLLGGISTARDGRKWLSVNMGRRLPNGELAQGGSGFSTPLDTP